ncbi:hypothetical protein GVAV_002233 [Gurleya vavrai]
MLYFYFIIANLTEGTDIIKYKTFDYLDENLKEQNDTNNVKLLTYKKIIDDQNESQYDINEHNNIYLSNNETKKDEKIILIDDSDSKLVLKKKHENNPVNRSPNEIWINNNSHFTYNDFCNDFYECLKTTFDLTIYINEMKISLFIKRDKKNLEEFQKNNTDYTRSHILSDRHIPSDELNYIIDKYKPYTDKIFLFFYELYHFVDKFQSYTFNDIYMTENIVVALNMILKILLGKDIINPIISIFEIKSLNLIKDFQHFELVLYRYDNAKIKKYKNNTYKQNFEAVKAYAEEFNSSIFLQSYSDFCHLFNNFSKEKYIFTRLLNQKEIKHQLYIYCKKIVSNKLIINWPEYFCLKNADISQPKSFFEHKSFKEFAEKTNLQRNHNTNLIKLNDSVFYMRNQYSEICEKCEDFFSIPLQKSYINLKFQETIFDLNDNYCICKFINNSNATNLMNILNDVLNLFSKEIEFYNYIYNILNEKLKNDKLYSEKIAKSYNSILKKVKRSFKNLKKTNMCNKDSQNNSKIIENIFEKVKKFFEPLIHSNFSIEHQIEYLKKKNELIENLKKYKMGKEFINQYKIFDKNQTFDLKNFLNFFNDQIMSFLLVEYFCIFEEFKTFFISIINFMNCKICKASCFDIYNNISINILDISDLFSKFDILFQKSEP